MIDISITPEMIKQLLTDIALAILIIIFSFWLSGFIKRRIVKLGLKYEELDDTLFYFLGSLARYAVLAIAGIFVLNTFGIQTTSLVALLGAAGLGDIGRHFPDTDAANAGIVLGEAFGTDFVAVLAAVLGD